MKIYFDTEFIEDGHTIDLLSIGMVREDGEEYYAEFIEADLYKASDWVKENVLPHLSRKRPALKTKWEIGMEIIDFVGENPEFWAWYAAYDWVALCQLYGPMISLPKGWPMYCRDWQQVVDESGETPSPQTDEDGPEHHALSDARWLFRVSS